MTPETKGHVRERQVTRVVVLGTGTGVGKTWVTRTLADALRRGGSWVLALKPIETGVVGGNAAGPFATSDASLLSRASSRALTAPPFAFSDAVSPHLAARRTGQRIELERVVEYVTSHETEVTSHVTSFILIESAGGSLSPLAPGVTNAELASALEPAIWILVAPDSLGVLHDVSATLCALGARARRPDHVVLCQSREPDASTGSNAAELEALGIVRPTATVSRGDEHALAALASALLASAGKASLT